jgi:hypothetical protein
MSTVTIRIVIKPYTNKELAPLFNASERTFRRDMAKIRHHLGKRNGHRWNVHQVERIMELLGRPYEVIEQDQIDTPQLKAS